MGGRRVCSTFIKLKHGDNEVDIFNPDCPMKLLVDSVRKRCAAPSRGDLAVAEESSELPDDEAVVTGVTELTENMENGRTFFANRGSYVLLSIQRKGDRMEYESLLDEEYMSTALKDKIHALNNPKAEQRRPSRVSKSKQPQSRNGSRAGRKISSVAQTRGKK